MRATMGLPLTFLMLPVASALQLRDDTVHKCVPVHIASDKSYFTVPVKVGSAGHAHEFVVDTGSTKILLQDRLATESTTRSGEEITLYYGSGPCNVEEANDILQIDAAQENRTFYLMKSGAQAFEQLEGILPLAVKKRSVLQSQVFKICLGGSGGQLNTIAKMPQLFVQATPRWEIQLQGISVNDHHIVGPSMFEDSDEAQVLPDTGTTFILGPLTHLLTIFSAACDKWAKCDSSDGKGSGFVSAVEKHCKTDLKHMPILKFHLGTGKQSTSVTLEPTSYVVAWKGKCIMAFDYFTYKPDYWILGQPLFYEHSVAFDAEKEHVGFIREHCTTCGDDYSRNFNAGSSFEQLRRIESPPRGPTRAYPLRERTFATATGEMANLQRHFDLRREEFDRASK